MVKPPHHSRIECGVGPDPRPGSSPEQALGGAGAACPVSTDQVRAWLEKVSDPEIPVISVIDLGVVRELRWENDGELVVTITPTYSGCPAMLAIEEAIGAALRERGIHRLRVETRLSPAWTTDWMSEKGKKNLRAYGIAPPAQNVIDIGGISRRRALEPDIACPHCGSSHSQLVSRFGSTACKAHYRCLDCLEPFDYFKPH